jgi:hypothetical protein
LQERIDGDNLDKDCFSESDENSLIKFYFTPGYILKFKLQRFPDKLECEKDDSKMVSSFNLSN